MMSALRATPTEAIRQELERRQQNLRVLQSRRDRLASELERLDEEIRSLSTPPDQQAGVDGAPQGRPVASTRRARARNDVSLSEAIARAVEVRATISPSEAAELVLANGYRSTAANFKMVVANTLARDKRFRRISRGQYERVA
jgi:hypothetical protein